MSGTFYDRKKFLNFFRSKFVWKAQIKKRCGMELEGVVHNGVIVLDDAMALPEGMRVRISPLTQEQSRTFGERFAPFKDAVPGLPADLAEQHDHYRLGTPKR
jgi:hypothetical protein